MLRGNNSCTTFRKDMLRFFLSVVCRVLLPPSTPMRHLAYIPLTAARRYAEVRPNNLDVELVLANTYLCFPESQRDCATQYGGSGDGGIGGTKGKSDGSNFKESAGRAIVVHADLTLTQIWRGMPQVGILPPNVWCPFISFLRFVHLTSFC